MINTITRTAVAAALCAIHLGAGAVDGRYILEACESAVMPSVAPSEARKVFQAGYCFGAVEAVRNHIVLTSLDARKGIGLCPKGDVIKKGEDVEAVVRYLRRRPELLREDSTDLIANALRLAYPCP